MDQLIVDTLVLDAARIDVTRIHHEFTQATVRTERLAGAVGHAELAEHIDAFASDWDLHREELSDQLEVVRDGLTAIVDGFAQTDADLARSVDSQRASYPQLPAEPRP